MAFIRNTDKFIEGSKLFFSNERAKAAVQSDLDQLSSEDSAIKLRLDVIEGSGTGSISKAQADAQAYADQKVAALVNSAPEVLDTLKELSDAIGGDASFAATVAGQIGSVDAKVDQEILDRQAAVSGEENRALAAEALLSGRIDALEADDTTKAYVDQQIAMVQGEVSAEESRAISAEGLLDGRLDTLEADPVTKAYVDGEVSSLEGQISAEQSARESADSVLSGRLNILEQDPTTKTYVDGEISSVEGQVSAEQSRAEGAESALSARLDTLELDPVTKTYVDGEVSDLQGQIDTEKGRIDAILSASEADKDSFAEIVELINSIDTSNDQGFASYVLSNDAALAQEVADRQVADQALDSKIGSLSELTSPDLEYDVNFQVFGNTVAIYVPHNTQDANQLLEIPVGTSLSLEVEYNGQTQTFGPYSVNQSYLNNYSLGEHVAIDLSGAANGSVDEDIKQAFGISTEPGELYTVTFKKVSFVAVASVVQGLVDERSKRETLAAQITQEISDRQNAISTVESMLMNLGSEVSYSKLFENTEIISASMEIDPNSGTQIFFCDVSSASVTITLPDPTSFGPGRKYVVKDMGSSSPSGNFITVAAQSGQMVDGQSSFEMKMPFEAAQFVSDGSQWFVM